MKSPVLIAREKECAQLQKCIESNRSEFVTVCGRRRIGKTFLVDQFFNYKYDFSFVGGHNVSTKVQLRNFAKALHRYSGKRHTLTNWYDAFDVLEEYLVTLHSDRKKIIFIDEMPWIDTQRSDFVSALENFWNGWANRRYDIVLIASGSATSWMADKLIENQGGLHNRITTRVYLSPFTLKETEEYLHSIGFANDRLQILQCYMFTGGVPFYLSLIDPQLSIAQNIDLLCFNPNGALRKEYDELYCALFKHVDSYIAVVRLLNGHKDGLTKKEIAQHCSVNGARLNTILKNLEECEFIAQRAIFGKKSATIYRLIDFYTLFYFKFIENDRTLDINWFTHHLDSPSVSAWMGLTFELICMQHHMQIKKALGISGISTSVYTWKCESTDEHKGAQIDMLIERADRMIHLCEMKFSQSTFNISNEYAMALRIRMSVFNEVTKNKKGLLHTFVTTFGLSNGKHNSIVNSEITMNDLFNS
ncbi:MAG: ATP-binding protein [Muribaculaceae bacterium]|nr:ATP-binding protein [Muribaculaceae bacterium]